jgi:hypothetical protein
MFTEIIAVYCEAPSKGAKYSLRAEWTAGTVPPVVQDNTEALVPAYKTERLHAPQESCPRPDLRARKLSVDQRAMYCSYVTTSTFYCPAFRAIPQCLLYFVRWLTGYTTARYTVLPEKKPLVAQLVKKFPHFLQHKSLLKCSIQHLHLSLPWATLIQSIPSHYISLRSILISSFHLR